MENLVIHAGDVTANIIPESVATSPHGADHNTALAMMAERVLLHSSRLSPAKGGLADAAIGSTALDRSEIIRGKQGNGLITSPSSVAYLTGNQGHAWLLGSRDRKATHPNGLAANVAPLRQMDGQTC